MWRYSMVQRCHLERTASILGYAYSEKGNIVFLRKVGNHLRDNTLS
jgi:hypothetical protein